VPAARPEFIEQPGAGNRFPWQRRGVELGPDERDLAARAGSRDSISVGQRFPPPAAALTLRLPPYRR
jgi:hypothetical protein